MTTLKTESTAEVIKRAVDASKHITNHEGAESPLNKHWLALRTVRSAGLTNQKYTGKR